MGTDPELEAPPETVELTWRGAVDVALEPLHRAVAHDLRSPLNALKLNLTLARRTLENDPSAARRWLEVVEGESRRLGALLDAYLKLATPTPDRDSAVIDLGLLLREIQPLLSCLAERQGVALELEVDGSAVARPRRGARRGLAALVASVLGPRAAGDGSPPEARTVRIRCAGDDGGARLELETDGLPDPAPVERIAVGLGGSITPSPGGITVSFETR